MNPDQQINHILEKMTDAFIALDLDWKIIYQNAAAEKINGKLRSQVIGKTHWEEWPASIGTNVEYQYRQAMAKQVPVQFEHRYYSPPDYDVWLEIRAYPSAEGLGIFFRDITEHKQAEAEQQARDERFKTLFNGMQDWVLVYQLNADKQPGCFIEANEQACQRLGYTRQELLNLSIHDIIDSHSVNVEAIIQKLLIHKNLVIESVHITKSGQFIPVEVSITLFTLNGLPTVQSICRDITERKQAEAALRCSEERFRVAQELSLDAFTILQSIRDETGEIVDFEWQYVNPKAANILQNTVEGLVGQRLLAVLPGNKTNSELFDRYVRVVETGEPHDIELCYESEGIVGWFRNMAVKLEDGVAISFSEITERKAAETERDRLVQALATERTHFEAVLQQMPAGVMIADAASGKLILTNTQAKQITDYPYQEGLLLPEYEPIRPFEGFHLDGKRYESQDYPLMRSLTSGEVVTNEEIELRWDGGHCIFISANSAPILDQQKQIIGAVLVFQDISDRKQAEAALQESEALAKAKAQELETLMEITPVALWIAHDPECHYITANQAAYNLMRAKPGSIATATPPDGCYPFEFDQCRNGQEILPADLPMQQAAKTGQEIIDEIEFVFADGLIRFIYGKAVPLHHESGAVRGVIAAFVDITERKHAEQEREELLARERAAREEAETANRIKDEFLAVLSHELRSPLNPILGWAKLLQSRRLDDSTSLRALQTIERNAKLQAQLIEDLLDVSRILRGKLVLNPIPIHLVNTIEAALETMCLAAQAKGIQIQTLFTTDVRPVMGDGGRLQQVILNLLSNAIKFTPSGGQITISLKEVEDFAQIQVQDTGKGISPEFLPHVFEYFRQADGSTTRQFGGLGLGLAIVRHMIELHGGSVEAKSAGEGMGATFTVKLPLIQELSEKTHNPEPLSVNDLSGVRVLVVDDEPDMRELVAFILETVNAQVQVVASATEALACFEAFQPNILISDIGMPEIDGYMLMRLLRKRSPQNNGQINAIALTAYAGEFNQQQALAAGFQHHLTKPIESSELIKIVAACVQSTVHL